MPFRFSVAEGTGDRPVGLKMHAKLFAESIATDESLNANEAAEAALKAFKAAVLQELDGLRLEAERTPKDHPYWRIQYSGPYASGYALSCKRITDAECYAIEAEEQRRERRRGQRASA